MEPRPYQSAAIARVEENWRTQHKSGCLVAPTGAGKTVMAEMLIRLALSRGQRVLFLAHRRELIKQAAKRFQSVARTGVVMASDPLDPSARIQVASIQTCLARGYWPPADVVICDEAHHYPSEEWCAFESRYPLALVCGLTATPERGDGKTLGDMFRWLVVAAHYQELVRAGYLVNCRAYQPPGVLRDGIAQDPLKAWLSYGRGLQTFGFARDVKSCERYTAAFKAYGIAAATVDYTTSARDRDYTLDLFREKRIKVVWSVSALTEGVDIPSAKCALLARQFNHVTPFLQGAGRVLRPDGTGQEAILIDLCGSTLIHGLPVEDRTYSLDGKGISRTSLAPLKNCPRCGVTILSAYPECPECGYSFEAKERRALKIWDFELQEVHGGDKSTPAEKEAEWRRMLEECEATGTSVSLALRDWHRVRAERPNMKLVSWELKHREFIGLTEYARANGYSKGYPASRFAQMFEHAPPSAWRRIGGGSKFDPGGRSQDERLEKLLRATTRLSKVGT